MLPHIPGSPTSRQDMASACSPSQHHPIWELWRSWASLGDLTLRKTGSNQGWWLQWWVRRWQIKGWALGWIRGTQSWVQCCRVSLADASCKGGFAEFNIRGALLSLKHLGCPGPEQLMAWESTLLWHYRITTQPARGGGAGVLHLPLQEKPLLSGGRMQTALLKAQCRPRHG